MSGLLGMPSVEMLKPCIESPQKYLDKAATKTRALVPNETALGKCVPGGVFTFMLMNVCKQTELLGILFMEMLQKINNSGFACLYIPFQI